MCVRTSKAVASRESPDGRPPSEVALSEGRFLKVKFTPEEDAQLARLVQNIGDNDWSKIASFMCNRNARQCRERYRNYLDPGLRWGGWTPEEDRLLMNKFNESGPRWNAIGRYFANRSDNSLRNRWHQLARRKRRHTVVSRSSSGEECEHRRSPTAVCDVVITQPRRAAHPCDLISHEEPLFDPFDFWNPFAE
jgi:hypothetical protein